MDIYKKILKYLELAKQANQLVSDDSKAAESKYLNKVLQLNLIKEEIKVYEEQTTDYNFSTLIEMGLLNYDSEQFQKHCDELIKMIKMKSEIIYDLIEREFITEATKRCALSQDVEDEVILSLSNKGIEFDLDESMTDELTDRSGIKTYKKIFDENMFRQMLFFTNFSNHSNFTEQAILREEFSHYILILRNNTIDFKIKPEIESHIITCINHWIINYYYDLISFKESYCNKFYKKIYNTNKYGLYKNEHTRFLQQLNKQIGNVHNTLNIMSEF